MPMHSRIEWEGNVGFWEEGKTRVPREKPFGAEKRTNNKLNPHVTSGLGIEPWTHWWEASTLTTAPSLLPIYSYWSVMRMPCFTHLIVLPALTSNFGYLNKFLLHVTILDTRETCALRTLQSSGVLHELLKCFEKYFLVADLGDHLQKRVLSY